MPQAPAPLQRVPLFRGIVKLVGALTPLVGRGSAAPLRGRILLAAALAAPLALPLLPGPYRSPALGVVTIALVASILRGRTLNLHGAEHRAIAAAEAGSLVATWRGAARPSRYSPRCGTNFAALLIPVAMLLDRFWLLPTTAFTPVLVVLPGLALQRLTTREPTLVETRVALRAVAAVLDHHAAS